MRAVTVLVYSPQRMFCSALAVSLDDEGHQVLGVVEHADDLPVEVRRIQPEVCAMDLAAAEDVEENLLDVVRRECPDTHIVVLTCRDDAVLWQAYDAGLVDAVVSKTHGLDTIRTAIDRAALGERFALASARPSPTPRPAHVSLTAREWEILRLLARGATTHQIMAALAISRNTLRTHVQHLLDKLHAHTRAQAVQNALTTRLLVDSDQVVS
jgi:DNA-binding NarL/FixJ family response regulator